MTEDNLLGKFELGGIPPAPRQPQTEVPVYINSILILSVAAEDKGSGESEKITIKDDQGRLTK